MTRRQMSLATARVIVPKETALSLGAIYSLPAGAHRRKLLLAWLHAADETGPRRICVNCRWQANLLDPDLRYLLKKGLVVQGREGGGRQHPLNRSSRKRQSYLELAKRS